MKKGCAIIYQAVKDSFATVLNVGNARSLEQREAQRLPRSDVSLCICCSCPSCQQRLVYIKCLHVRINPVWSNQNLPVHLLFFLKSSAYSQQDLIICLEPVWIMLLGSYWSSRDKNGQNAAKSVVYEQMRPYLMIPADNHECLFIAKSIDYFM